eukprot:TRINITY_DN11542_c0_g2_i1.p1 TRINITY_DN11542_c0_g2~~TRINITY_DN11542_c0_g2_i1.p1  ORF type:complete len:1173 (-),score=281.19 TRINITY_DN11542_c0_g2_i1:59-3355(-)
MAAAQAQAALVSSALAAVGAYTEWVPVGALLRHGIIDACAYLLQSTDFRVDACSILKQVAARKRPNEDPVPFDDGIAKIMDAITGASLSILSATSGTGELNEADLQFADKLCEALVAITPSNVRRPTIKCPERRSKYLQSVLGFFRHRAFPLHAQALNVCLSLLRDSALVPLPETLLDPPRQSPDTSSPPKSSLSAPTSNNNGGSKRKGKKNGGGEEDSPPFFVPTEVYTTLIEVVAERMPRKGAQEAEEEGGFQFEMMDALEFSNYKSRLHELIKLLASRQTMIAAGKILPHVDTAVKAAVASPSDPQAIRSLDCAQCLLENLFHGTPPHFIKAAIAAVLSPKGRSGGGPTGGLGSTEYRLGFLFQGITRTLLNVEWQDPVLVELHGRLLDALGPYVRMGAPETSLILSKFFSLLASLPQPKQALAPGFTRTSERYQQLVHSRLRVCASLLRLCEKAEGAVGPFLEVMAKQIEGLRQQNQIQQAELTYLGEALLVIGAASGAQQQAQVMDWLLSPVRRQWEDATWQQVFIGNGPTLARLLSTEAGAAERPDGSPGNVDCLSLWWIYDDVALFDKTLQRTVRSEAGQPPGSHPIAPHLAWILGPLFQLLRCLHELWSPSAFPSTSPVLAGAMRLSKLERAALVGQTGPSGSRAATPSAAGGDREAGGGGAEEEGERESRRGGREGREAEVHSWLRGVREFGYSSLGLAASKAPSVFFTDTDRRASDMCRALLENFPSMESWHIKNMLRLLLQPLIRACPPEQWGIWLEPLLPPILHHTRGLLETGWSNLQQKGAVIVPEGSAKNSDKALIDETDDVLAEKLLRDLSREVLALLALLANTPPTRGSSPSKNGSEAEGSGSRRGGAEQAGGAAGEDVQGRAPADGEQEQPSLLRFIIQRSHIAQPALLLATSALQWPDSETSHRALLFCTGVAALPELTASPNPDPASLCQYVAQTVFRAALQGLTLESNAAFQADFVGLLKDIYLRTRGVSNAPREILLSLPSVTEETLGAFDAALAATNSLKDQRLLMKQLLLQGAGGENLRAFLVAMKGPNPITSVPSAAIIADIRQKRQQASFTAATAAQHQDATDGRVGLAMLGL